MKKIFALAIGLVLFLAVGSVESVQFSNTHIIENNTGVPLITNVSTATIIPGIHKLVGYTVLSNLGSKVGAWVTVYSGSPGVNTNLVGEAESIAHSSDGEVWGYPKAVRAGGVTIRQSCYSTVLIEYTR